MASAGARLTHFAASEIGPKGDWRRAGKGFVSLPGVVVPSLHSARLLERLGHLNRHCAGAWAAAAEPMLGLGGCRVGPICIFQMPRFILKFTGFNTYIVFYILFHRTNIVNTFTK